MDVISLVILFGIVQGFFLGILLIIMRSPNHRANRVLGILFFCFSMSITHFFLLRTRLYDAVPSLVHVSFPFLFLFGPLYYLYARILTDRTTVIKRREWLHGIPFVLACSVNIPFLLQSREQQLAYIRTIQDPVWIHMGLIIGGLQVLHIAVYIGVVLNILARYDEQIKSTTSSIEKINLRWLRTGTIGFIVVFSLIFLLLVLQAFGIPTLAFYSVSVPIIVSMIIYLLGYLGLRQPEIFSPAEIRSRMMVFETAGEVEKKYERSSLTPERSEEYAGRIRTHMTTNHPHLDAELTLSGLAEQLGIPAHHLSQIINSQFNSNFFDFVNKYRVEEAKRLLLDQSKAHYTIFALAQEAGFNSKTAFNAAFKRLTGHTPSAFRAMRATG
jgi:AraC-like DNA-binding protein